MNQFMRYNNGMVLSYAEYGKQDGYSILVQHGLIASIRDHHLFDRLIEAGVHLICIARPGYGESSPYSLSNMAEWGDIIALLVDTLNITQCDVLGMSSGAPYSYAIGRTLSKKVRNIFIFSGIPALYDERILALWPYEVRTHAHITDLEKLSKELFFSNLSTEDLLRNDIRDSMMHDCFGIAQDLKLRCVDWGFDLSEIRMPVYMQHSMQDTEVPFHTAEITATLLPRCLFDVRKSGGHFSDALLDDFIQMSMLEHYKRNRM
jgi:pimeloyl-ACP methyl ester carboxylesterase